MAKVVYNACYGGFGLSKAATERLAAMGVQGAKEHLADPEAVRFFSYERVETVYCDGVAVDS